jgi:hypothetical protein
MAYMISENSHGTVHGRAVNCSPSNNNRFFSVTDNPHVMIRPTFKWIEGGKKLPTEKLVGVID